MDILLKYLPSRVSQKIDLVSLLRRVLSVLILGCLVALVVSPSAFAAEPEAIQMDLSPFAGTGKTSTGNSITNHTGMGISASIPFRTAARTLVGPKFEAMNSLVNTSYDGSTDLTASYDHRIFTAGISAELLLGESVAPDDQTVNGRAGRKSVYGTLSSGKVFSKMVLDESSDRTFSQTSYSGISGSYLGGELGVRIPVRDNFSVAFGLVAAMTRISQNVEGRGEGEQVIDNAYLTAPAVQNATEVLPEIVVQKTIAAKAGFSIGF